jgi:hypothetical protein
MTMAARTKPRAIVTAKTVIHMAHLHPWWVQRAYPDLVSFSGTITSSKRDHSKNQRDQWLRKGTDTPKLDGSSCEPRNIRATSTDHARFRFQGNSLRYQDELSVDAVLQYCNMRRRRFGQSHLAPDYRTQGTLRHASQDGQHH